MNKDNTSKLWKMIQEAGDYLQNKLPDSSIHPKGRNPYAHVALCIKDNFGLSYKDINDNDHYGNFVGIWAPNINLYTTVFKKYEEYIVAGKSSIDHLLH